MSECQKVHFVALRFIWKRYLDLKTHLKDWKNPGSNPSPVLPGEWIILVLVSTILLKGAKLQ